MSNFRDRLPHLSLEARVQLEQRLLGRIQDAPPIPIPADDSPKLLSYAQESLWFFDQLVPHSCLYNIPQAFLLRGKLDRVALQRAFARLVERHHALRTRFQVVDGMPVQVVQEKRFELEFTQIESGTQPERDSQVQRLISEEAHRPFDLSNDLLLRARLIGLDEATHVLAMSVHHIVADFTSLQILHRELAGLYRGFLAGREEALAPLPMHFPDWASRQRRLAESPALAPSIAYWQRCLDGQLPSLEMPTDWPRPQARTFNGRRQSLAIPAPLAGALRELASREGVTVYMLLLAAFQTLLYRYSHREDILVGSPTGQRGDSDTRLMIGFLLNTLVLRTDLSGKPSFRELLQRTREVVIGALAHQDVPFEKLVERLHRTREHGSNPLCQTIFQYLPCAWPAPELPGISAEPVEMETDTAKFELTLTILDGADGFSGDMEYNTDLFEHGTIQRLLTNFRVLLESIVATPAQRIDQLPVLSPAERHQLVIEWNQTAIPYPRDSCVHELFEEQVSRSPNAVAVLAKDEAATYDQLNRQANRLARRLIEAGLQPGGRVGVCVERSIDMIVGLLAILKAGAAYVPIDPTYPPDRIHFMLQDAAVNILIAKGRGAARPDWPGTLLLLDGEGVANSTLPDHNLPNHLSSEAVAYVMYTSGSTGQPKGVAIPHRGVVRLVKGSAYARLDSSEIFLQFAPLTFDASTFEIWGALLNGAKLVLYPPQFGSLEEFVETLTRYQVTTLWLTAGLFHELVDEHLAGLGNLRQLLAGGDVLSVPHVLKFLRELPQCRLVNGYGPTENTTFTCCHSFPQHWAGAGSAPIGRPISNTQVYVLDEHLVPVPIGVAGELHIAGDGLALGYLNSPELTARKFIQNPFSTAAAAKLYKSGDQVRYLADGTLAFLGRLDDQVKINGFRIHLQEVEAALQEISSVQQAVVLARANNAGARELVAYVVPKGAAIPASDLKAQAARTLPSYMVPVHFVVLPSLPLTANGKVDRRSLPSPDEAVRQTEGAGEPVPPTNPVEEQILDIWKEVFGRQALGIDDNFFDLGGHSLLATRVISRLNKAFQSDLSLAALFETPTTRALAKAVASQRDSAPGPIKRRKSS